MNNISHFIFLWCKYLVVFSTVILFVVGTLELFGLYVGAGIICLFAVTGILAKIDQLFGH